MGSKRRTNFQWQLFWPLVSGLWLVLIAMGIWTFHNNYQYKLNRVYEQLNLVNQRIIAFYYNGATENDVRPYLEFVYEYYRDSPEFDKIRITVYKDGQLRYSYGEPVQLSDEELQAASGLTVDPGIEVPEELAGGNKNGQYFYYRATPSADGRLVAITVLPFDKDVSAAVMPSLSIFVALLIVAIIITSIAFFASRHFARNIRLLRTVAEKAASDPNFIPAVDFPHDELGDINRQIVHIFKERAQALSRLKHEHAVAMHAIEEKAKAKRQMSSNISHELRTPIGVIKGYLDTIVENPDMDADTRMHFITKAQHHANRLVTIITDVSAISRLEDGGELISTEELNFHDLVFTLSNDFDESGILGDMTFSFDIPMDCIVMGNYNLLNNMLMNLSRNAAAYSRGSLCELLFTGEDDSFYHFVFRDNGTGVGEEHIPHLFERFYRVDSGRARKAGGSGLGLPIVQSTIQAHGGTITVENRPTGGLCYRFTLPKIK